MNVQPTSAGLATTNATSEADARAATSRTRNASRPEPVQNQTNQAANATQQPSRTEVDNAVSQIKDFVSMSGKEINFTVDEASGIQVVKVMDKSTDQVIRQIPSEEVVAIARALDKLQGLFVSDKV